MSESRGAAEKEAKSTATKQGPLDDGTNIKETIESILVAFILAFIFRAFVVEAFVIPTGSMAPTLLGAHMRFRCPDCGYTFDVNYSSPSEDESEDMNTPATAFPATAIYCPNCGDLVASPAGQSAEPSVVNYGDRILVLKYIYLLHPPRRWDVVVFKSPDDPAEKHYQENYIKRLVGLPNEKLMVLDGNIYIWKEAESKWKIPKDKPREAQGALWRLVYDNDFYPQNIHHNWVQPWKQVEGGGWNLGTSAADGRTFVFDKSDGGGMLRFDPNANTTTQTLTDYLVYDASPSSPNGGPNALIRRPGVSGVGSRDDEAANPVSDLKLATLYDRISGSGPFRLELSRFEDVDHTFTAEITPDEVSLLYQTSTGEQQRLHRPLAELGIRGDKPIFMEFMNVDYRVTLRLNGTEAFAPLDYEPNVEWLEDQWRNDRRGRPGEADIEAQNQKCTIGHISLWRDVYYTDRGSNGGNLVTGSPTNPAVLGPREFFTMGDNSQISRDARWWDVPIDLPHEGLEMAAGRVPEQFMLGKAVFVYWPAGFRIYDHLSVIPDFGDMRWIH
jgi:signal peptidase I